MELLYSPAVVSIKISILLLYARIFQGISFRRVLSGVGGFVIGYSILHTVITLFHCIPVRALWDMSIKGQCLNFSAALVVFGCLNMGRYCKIVPSFFQIYESWLAVQCLYGHGDADPETSTATDVAILLLPMPQLMKLKISTERKIQLIAMFLLGGL